MKQRLIEELTELLGNDRVLTNEPMSRHTTFRIGGPADLFLLPNTVEEIKKNAVRYVSGSKNHILSWAMEVICW